jgi:hypothetical protein
MFQNVLSAKPPSMQNLCLSTVTKHAGFEVSYKTSPFNENSTFTLYATSHVAVASDEGWDSSVGIVTRLHARRQRATGLIPGWSKRCVCSPKLPGSYSAGTGDSVPCGKATGERTSLVPSSAEIKNVWFYTQGPTFHGNEPSGSIKRGEFLD